MSGWMNKEKWSQEILIGYNMSGPWGQYVKWHNSVIGGQIQLHSTSIKYLNKSKKQKV